MTLKWLGTAFLIVESKNAKILFDPFIKAGEKNITLYEIENADAVFITHPHFDHLKNLPEIISRLSCPVYLSERGVEIAKAHGCPSERLVAVCVGEEVEIKGLKVRIYRGEHCKFDLGIVLKTALKIRPANFNKALKIRKLNSEFKMDSEETFCFRIGRKGENLFIMGSAGLDYKEKYPKIQTLVYPYQGRSDIKDYSLKIMKHLNPKRVILDHFDDSFPPVTSDMDTSEIISAAKDSLNLPVTVPAPHMSIRL